MIDWTEEDALEDLMQSKCINREYEAMRVPMDVVCDLCDRIKELTAINAAQREFMEACSADNESLHNSLSAQLTQNDGDTWRQRDE